MGEQERERVGRLIVDVEMYEEEREVLVNSINEGGPFEAEQQTIMRIDVFRVINNE